MTIHYFVDIRDLLTPILFRAIKAKIRLIKVSVSRKCLSQI
jgi:hypothetical protein